MHSTNYSIAAVKEKKKLSVSLVNEAMLQRADYMGIVSGKKTDKSAICLYPIGDGGTTVIEDQDLVMECELVNIYEIDSFENFLLCTTYTCE